MPNERGSILVYAIFLTLLAMSLGYVFLSKSEILLENLSFQGYDAKMSRNIRGKADMALSWATSLNANGGNFQAALKCPTVTMSGTTEWGVLETLETVPTVADETLFCLASTASGIDLRLDYSPDYATFLTGTYVNAVSINPSGTATELGGTFSDPEGKVLAFSLPSEFSDIDGDLNSDDYRSGSTGSVLYPSGYADDDADARIFAIGMVRHDSGWNNVFWNHPRSNAVIENNPNNDDSQYAKLPSTSSGYLHLDIDRPFSLKIVEFDAEEYRESGRLVRTSSEERTSMSGAIGYVQNDLSLSGTRIPGDDARTFDFANRQYAVFVAYSTSDPEGVTHLKYRLSAENESGSWLYLVPIDDALEWSVKYLGSDILIDAAGNYRSKILEFSSPKTGIHIIGACRWTWGDLLDGACIVPE